MPKKPNRRSVASKKIICNQCECEIKEETDDFIRCDKCERDYHSQCSGLSRREFERLLKNDSEIYNCQHCKEGGGEIKKELKRMNEELKKLEKLDKLDQLTDSINFMSAKFDEVIKDVEANKKKISEVEKENKKLKNEIQTLKTSVKFLNDFRVKNDCIISGLKVDTTDKAVDAVIKLSKEVGVDFESNSFEDVYFIGKKSQQSDKKTVVVKFASKVHKEKLMDAKKKLKEKDNTKMIYVNDFHSKETLNLFYHAKSLKTVGYQQVYAANGKVFCKKTNTSKNILIRSEDDVDRMLLDATTNNQWKRRSMIQVREAADDGDSEDGEDDDNYVSP